MDGIADSLGLPDFSTHVQQMIRHPQNAWICGGFDRDIEGSLEDWVIVLEQFGQYRLQVNQDPFGGDQALHFKAVAREERTDLFWASPVALGESPRHIVLERSLLQQPG